MSYVKLDEVFKNDTHFYCNDIFVVKVGERLCIPGYTNTHNPDNDYDTLFSFLVHVD